MGKRIKGIMDQTVFATLPRELVTDILMRLPMKSLLRCRCVSKSFRSFIDSRDFNDSIMSRSQPNLMFPTSERFSTNYGSAEFNVSDFQLHSWEYGFEVYGYGDGVFVLLFDQCKPALWNPSTHQKRILPCFPFDPNLFAEYFDIGVGFGYDSSGDEYKFVAIEPYSRQFPPNVVEYRVWVFGLRSNSWRRALIDSQERSDCEAYVGGFRFGCFAHGVLYWLCANKTLSQQIVAFDLAKETLSILATPDYKPVMGMDTNLHVSGGCLFMSFFTILTRPKEARLYVRKKVDEAEFAWTLLYSVTTDQLPPFLNIDGFYWMEVLGYSKEEDKIMLHLHSRCVVSYDLKEKRFQMSDITISPIYSNIPARSFVESLVSLHTRDRNVRY